jgi:hypothetical protein
MRWGLLGLWNEKVDFQAMLSMMFNLRNIELCVSPLSKASLNYVLFRNREWCKSCCGKDLEGNLNIAGPFKVTANQTRSSVQSDIFMIPRG